MRHQRALAMAATTATALFVGVAPLAEPAAAANVTTISLPMTCSFGTVATVAETAVVTVAAPKQKAAGTRFKVTFRTEDPELSPVPFEIDDFSLTSRWTVLGPVQPATAGPFTSPTVTIPSGGNVTFPTSHHLYKLTGSHGEVVSYQLDGIAYRFATTPSTPLVTATCRLDNGPTVVASTTVQ
jgi:hypothetical protein